MPAPDRPFGDPQVVRDLADHIATGEPPGCCQPQPLAPLLLGGRVPAPLRIPHASVIRPPRPSVTTSFSTSSYWLATLQPFDLILLVVIGDLIQSGVTQNDLSVTGVIIVVSTIGILQVGISYLGFRVRRLRPFLEGEPIVLVEKGKIIDRNMRRERLTLDDLAEKARISEIESLDEVKWAVLETNGDISFIKQSSS